MCCGGWGGQNSGYIVPIKALTLGFFKLSLATPIDADYVALRVILNINKVLVNLQ